MNMNIFLIPIGSAGDVHPFIGVGCELKRRGHRVTVFTNDYFKPLILSTGLDFLSSSSVEHFNSAMEDPRLWDPNRGFEFIVRRSFLPMIPLAYRMLEEHYVPGETIAVASSLAWGARVAQEKLGVPVVSLHLQPAMLPSLYQTPIYSPFAWLASLPIPLKKIYFQMIDFASDAVVAPELNRFRSSIGLRPVKRILREWTHSPLRTICLFPDWFAPAQADWPSSVRFAGFPLYDAEHIQQMPPEVQTFLDGGPAPIVFTAGSAMQHAGRLFEVAVEACVRLKRRGLLINAFQDQIPSSLPPGVMATRYAPFSQVFARASAVVHHGGIGTTAQALAAGTMQLVTPFAHDQFDNAARIVRLGVGKQISPKNFQISKVVQTIDALMKDYSLRIRAQEIKTKLNGPAAISRTCDLVLEAVSVNHETS